MNYDEYIGFVQDAEAHDSVDRDLSVDVYDLGPAVRITEYDDSQVASVIAYIDGLDAPKRQGAEQAKGAPGRPIGPNAAQMMNRISTQTSEIGKAAKSEEQRIGKELGSLISATEGGMSKLMKRKESKLVMVNLSLQDQISELEKIDLNLELNAFDKEQLAIVKAEIKGLMKSRGAAPADEFQRNLFEMRNKRLEQVAKRL